MELAPVPLKWTSGLCGMRRGEQPLGVMDSLLFSFVRGARIPRLAHSALPKVEDLLCLSILTEGWMLVPFASAFCTFLTLHIILWEGGEFAVQGCGHDYNERLNLEELIVLHTKLSCYK
jgi:hypothetical protein